MLKKGSFIASIHNEDSLQLALSDNHIDTLFLMYGDILTVSSTVERIHFFNKKVCLHVDFIQGLSPDKKGMEFLSQFVKPDGIISTRGQVIQHAKKVGLFSIQRLFLIDSGAYHSGIKSVLNSKPDAVEAMPGMMPRVLQDLTKSLDLPIVAGGLFKQADELQAALHAGAIAVSTGSPELWKVAKLLNSVQGV
ncbi:glycerol-3-phosphate responsive antiterminator [Bacillus sp. 31A1R]|uniref:Glycerol uptake operon antiterminator regulatory protein n=1 Tax=Robertmurraya mangrovi TaxID=3098077 RepID=A0ABU5J1R2_9BACI|nr:glycerol-3-phosphate responsive antiterminator [Bacillus sp. 31A1R]MDZ5473291.1 glycerol-3-phosphate responsive antiterminator [Bacillus sp. 31A1R]